MSHSSGHVLENVRLGMTRSQLLSARPNAKPGDSCECYEEGVQDCLPSSAKVLYRGPSPDDWFPTIQEALGTARVTSVQLWSEWRLDHADNLVRLLPALLAGVHAR